MTEAKFSAEAHAAAMRKAGHWSDLHFDEFVVSNGRETPDKPAIIADSAGHQKTLSFGELEVLVSKTATSLLRLGLRRGDVLAIQSPGWWEAVVVILACLRTGIVVNPLIPIFRERELTFMLGFAEAKAFVAPKSFGGFDFEAMANDLKDALPSLEHVIVMRGEGPNSFEASFLQHPEPPASRTFPVERMPGHDDLAVLMYTSGTTGSPKGVMHTENTLLCCIDNVIARGSLTGEDVILVGAPVGHMIGLATGVLIATRLGATMVLQEVWNDKRAVELILQEGVTFSAGATPYLAGICDVSAASARKPETLRLFLCAGAPIPPALVERAGREFDLRVTSVWGMTETLANTMTEPERAFEKSPKTDGRPLAGSEVKVVGNDRERLPNGTVGSLMVRGAQMLIGYYKRPDLQLFDSEGWMDTGDLAYMDDEGYIRIAGRTKDIIIRGGENIPVADIENVLYEHPAISAVALVGYPDDRLGERGCAFVQLRPDASFDFAAMQAHLAAKKVAKQFWPERLEIDDALPRTPSGKIQKFLLKERAGAFKS